MKRLIPLIALLAILTIFSSYTYGILAENDDNLNVDDTAYEDGYEGNVKVQTATSSMLGIVPLIITVVALMIGLAAMRKAYFGR